MTEKEELLKTALQEVDLVSTKQRFGYFSMPANLSIGDYPNEKTSKDDFIQGTLMRMGRL